MSNTDTPNPTKPTAKSVSKPVDDALTVTGIAVLAFIVADMVHEGLGHGLGFYFAGGHSSMLTTTRLIEWVQLGDPQWRIFDLGGPAGNLLFGFLPWLGQRIVRGEPVRLRLFFWLVMTFSLFWAFGYLIFCGVIGRGDWMALVKSTRFVLAGRIIFALAGIALYRATIRLAASEMRWIVPARNPQPDSLPYDLYNKDAKSRVARIIRISYLSGGIIACAGAVLDPRGAWEILNSGALSSFGAAIGMLYVARIFSSLPEKHAGSNEPISRGLPWLIAASAGAIYYILILGPGILMYFQG